MAYQIAFDLYESATQHFLRKVQETLRAAIPKTSQSRVNGAVEAKISMPVEETGSHTCALIKN